MSNEGSRITESSTTTVPGLAASRVVAEPGLSPGLAEYCSSLAREWEDSVWSLIDAAERLSRE